MFRSVFTLRNRHYSYWLAAELLRLHENWGVATRRLTDNGVYLLRLSLSQAWIAFMCL